MGQKYSSQMGLFPIRSSSMRKWTVSTLRRLSWKRTFLACLSARKKRRWALRVRPPVPSFYKKHKDAGRVAQYLQLLTEAALEDAVNEVLLLVKRLEDELLSGEKELRERIYQRLLGYRFSGRIERNRII